MATTPSLAMIPSGYKTGKLYSVLPTNGDGDFDFTRSTTATRVNKDGFIEEVASNVPRLDYSDGGCPSLLLEGTRSNISPYSEAFDNGYWTKSGSSVVSGFTSPKGDLTAFKLTEDTNNSEHFMYSQNSGGSVGNQITTSFFVKSESRNWCRIIGYNGSSVWFDLENGAIGTQTNAIGKIKLISNGWYKISSSYTSSNSTNEKSYLYLVNGNNNVSYQGDGTSGIYVWGSQLEVGSYATSYIPTQGQSGGVTRVADNCSIDNLDDYVSSGSSWTATGEFVKGQDTDSSLYILYAYYLASSNLFRIRDFANFVSFYLFIPIQSNINYSSSLGDTIKWAIRAKSDGSYSVYVNGVSIAEANGTFQKLDKYTINGSAKNKIKDLRVYNTALTDAELQALTT